VRSRRECIPRKGLLLFCINMFGMFMLMSPQWVQCQERAFPAKQVEVIVPFAPGGSLDVGTRIFAEALAKELKVPVVIKNQVGGGGLTGATVFFHAKPDGYTILAASPAAIISNVKLSSTPSFDPRKDFLPLGYIGHSPVAMAVSKESPFQTFNDFLQYARKNPGKLQGGVSALGGETHIMFMSILKDTKIDSKLIPYTTAAALRWPFSGDTSTGRPRRWFPVCSTSSRATCVRCS
jgi:tripartite-type tricarboxylate transporter receptor subunit TctC